MATKTKKRILVIDDDHDLLVLLKARIEAGGYDVLTALDGSRGLKVLAESKVDIIILDILMPVMDGFTFFKTIRENPKYYNLPVAIITGRSRMKDTFEALGVDDVIIKPFNDEDLLSRVEALVSPKALVLASDSAAVNRIKSELTKCSYEVTVVDCEDEMRKKGLNDRYRALIVHIGLIKKEPGDFIKVLKSFKHSSPIILAYSDVTVQGTESGDNLLIDELKTKWQRAGARAFFDPRTEKTFPNVF